LAHLLKCREIKVAREPESYLPATLGSPLPIIAALWLAVARKVRTVLNLGM